MMTRILVTIITFLLCCSTCGAAYNPLSDDLRLRDKLLKMPTSRLSDMAGNTINALTASDTVALCLSIITDRYQRNPVKQDAHAAMRANIQLWRIYMFKFQDYQRALAYIDAAKNIAVENNIKDADIPLGFSCVYYTIAEETNNDEMLKKSEYFLCEAFETGISTNSQQTVDAIFIDLLNTSVKNSSKLPEESFRQYLDFIKGKPVTPMMTYNMNFYAAEQNVLSGNVAEAIDLLTATERSLEDNIDYVRHRIFILDRIAELCRMAGDSRGSYGQYLRALNLARSVHEYDMVLSLYDTLRKHFKTLGMNDSAMHYSSLYYQLHDSIMHFRQLNAVAEYEFNQKEKVLMKEAERIHSRNSRITAIGIAAIVVLLVVIGVLLLMLRHSRKVRERQRKMVSAMQATIAMSPQQTLPSVDELAGGDHEQTVDDALIALIPDAPQPSSSRSDVKKTALSKVPSDSVSADRGPSSEIGKVDPFSVGDTPEPVKSILAVLASEQIYEPDFSLESLAKILNLPAYVISRTINSFFRMNFNRLLNIYRVKAVCRMLQDDDRYGNLTVDAIAEAVGYRSKSSFYTAFRSETGVTPKAYKKYATEDLS